MLLQHFRSHIVTMARSVLLMIALCCLTQQAFAKEPVFVRVAIAQDVASLRLKVKGFFEAVDLERNVPILHAKSLDGIVSANSEGILLGSIQTRTSRLLIRCDDPEILSINGRLFRGYIRFVKKNDDRLLVTNDIELEDYIKGILYHEVSHYWPMESLMAQAIVCRTYAVYQINKQKDFDLTSDIYSQVYGGKTSERYRTNKAVELTKGKVLVYQGKIFPAYFHATCAGHTEDAANLWNINIAPLKGVVCGFCKESPHYSWHEVLTTKELEEKLSAAGIKVSGINDIQVLGTNASGRATQVRIVSLFGDRKIPAKDLRSAVGPNIIRSTKFSVSVVDKDVVFEGFGWGHGVGLCQWGAYFMGKSGKTYQQILRYYYPRCEISSIPEF